MTRIVKHLMQPGTTKGKMVIPEKTCERDIRGLKADGGLNVALNLKAVATSCMEKLSSRQREEFHSFIEALPIKQKRNIAWEMS